MDNKKHVDQTAMRVNAYQVLQRAVNEGIGLGWHRAFKHTEEPPEELIRDEIENAVMNEICEWFSFDDEPARGVETTNFDRS